MQKTFFIFHCVLAVSTIFTSNAFGELVEVTRLNPMNEARHYFGAAANDRTTYVFGGQNQVDVTDTVKCYGPNKKWSYCKSMPGKKAWEKAAIAQDGKIYLFGGSTDSTPSTDVWVFDPRANKWDTSTPQMPVAERDTVAITGTDGTIYLFGGYSHYDTVQAFTPSQNTWSTKSPMPTGRWAAAGALGPDGKMYIVGGGFPGQPDFGVYNTLEVYDPKTDSWTTKSSMPTARNYLGAAFGGDGLLYAIGGEVYGAGRTGIIYDVIEAYNPRTDKWIIAGHLPVGLSGLSAVTDKHGNIHVFGGYKLTEGTPVTTNLHFYLKIK